jgi:glycosyltransferase involved in cell wall biosynthesis
MIEALFSGTPVITSDWACFAENNLHGITGYRCRTMEQFVWATRNIDKINPKACREWAMNNFSLEVVAKMYEEYFDNLVRMKQNGGWYADFEERENLDWLVRHYPTC